MEIPGLSLLLVKKKKKAAVTAFNQDGMFGDFCGLDKVLASEFKHEEVICFCFASPQSQNGLVCCGCSVILSMANRIPIPS